MFPSNAFSVYKEFFFSLVAVFAISTLQSLDTQLWPFVFMLLMVVVFSGKYGRVDLTMSNTLARWFVECDESLNALDVFWTLFAQFVGAILGSILYCAIVDQPTLIMSPAPASDNRWRALLCFIFFHGVYYQVVASYKRTNNPESAALLGKKSSQEDSLERSLGMAFAYSSVAVAFQVFAMGAFGGINLDLGRQFGSKLIHSDLAGDNLKETWWILLLGPLGGVLQAKGALMLEGLFAKDAAKTDDNAKGDVEEVTMASAGDNA